MGEEGGDCERVEAGGGCGGGGGGRESGGAGCDQAKVEVGPCGLAEGGLVQDVRFLVVAFALLLFGVAGGRGRGLGVCRAGWIGWRCHSR